MFGERIVEYGWLFSFFSLLIFQSDDIYIQLFLSQTLIVRVTTQIFGILALLYGIVLIFLLGTLMLILRGEETGDGDNSNLLTDTTAIRWAQVSMLIFCTDLAI